MRNKARVSAEDCAACGCCVKVCPRAAITVPHGVCAVVDADRCVGCGKCVRECPASIISLEAAEA